VVMLARFCATAARHVRSEDATRTLPRPSELDVLIMREVSTPRLFVDSMERSFATFAPLE